jgi:hypothetical protein
VHRGAGECNCSNFPPKRHSSPYTVRETSAPSIFVRCLRVYFPDMVRRSRTRCRNRHAKTPILAKTPPTSFIVPFPLLVVGLVSTQSETTKVVPVSFLSLPLLLGARVLPLLSSSPHLSFAPLFLGCVDVLAVTLRP